MSVRFNFNDSIWVKLTPMGEQVCIDHYKSYGLSNPKLVKNWRGYTQFQLWEFANIFKDYMHAGAAMPFEMEMEFV